MTSLKPYGLVIAVPLLHIPTDGLCLKRRVLDMASSVCLLNCIVHCWRIVHLSSCMAMLEPGLQQQVFMCAGLYTTVSLRVMPAWQAWLPARPLH